MIVVTNTILCIMKGTYMVIDKLKNPIICEDIEHIIQEPLDWCSFKDKTVLITGASGMIPSYILYTMLGLNDKYGCKIKVLALVRNEEKARRIFGSLLEREDIQLLVQDVSTPLEYNEGKIDYIFHGGSPARPSEHNAAPTSTIKANLLGTINLLDLAVKHQSEAFVLMSSSEVYGSVSENINSISETDYGYLDCQNPRACYSEGKRAAETICAAYSAQYNITCKTPRFAHIYGPGLGLNDGRVQAEFASKVFRNENIVMNSDGSSKRAYTYVSDAVAGVFYILLKGSDMAYNIADSENVISIKQLAEAFLKARPESNLQLIMNIDKEASKLYNPAKFIGLDNRKVKALGWSPRVSIAEGTSRMIKHYEITEH